MYYITKSSRGKFTIEDDKTGDIKHFDDIESLYEFAETTGELDYYDQFKNTVYGINQDIFCPTYLVSSRLAREKLLTGSASLDIAYSDEYEILNDDPGVNLEELSEEEASEINTIVEYDEDVCWYSSTLIYIQELNGYEIEFCQDNENTELINYTIETDAYNGAYYMGSLSPMKSDTEKTQFKCLHKSGQGYRPLLATVVKYRNQLKLGVLFQYFMLNDCDLSARADLILFDILMPHRVRPIRFSHDTLVENGDMSDFIYETISDMCLGFTREYIEDIGSDDFDETDLVTGDALVPVGEFGMSTRKGCADTFTSILCQSTTDFSRLCDINQYINYDLYATDDYDYVRDISEPNDILEEGTIDYKTPATV